MSAEWLMPFYLSNMGEEIIQIRLAMSEEERLENKARYERVQRMKAQEKAIQDAPFIEAARLKRERKAAKRKPKP